MTVFGVPSMKLHSLLQCTGRAAKQDHRTKQRRFSGRPLRLVYTIRFWQKKEVGHVAGKQFFFG